jgi:hypothetical protein
VLRRIRLLVAAALCGITASACDLSLRDQVDLIQKNEEWYRLILPGSTVQCATLGTLTIVRAEGAKFFSVMDPHWVFHRWEQTGAYFVGDGLDAIRVFLSTYARYGPLGLWRNWGRPPFEAGEPPSLPDGSMPAWQPIALIDRDQYETALSVKLKPEQVQFIREVTGEQIRLYLFDNDYADAKIIGEQYGQIGLYSSRILATIRVRRGRKEEILDLSLPINAAMSPFVGHVEPMALAPHRR